MSLMLEDTTLREGEQSPGVAFSLEEKVTIARMLQDIGIHAIEVGTPAMGGPEEEAIKALVRGNLSVRLIGWNRGRKSDLEASFACGLDSVHIGLPSSDHHLDKKFKKDRQWVMATMQELVAYAKGQGAWVSVSAEDSGRADVDFLCEYAKAAAAAGADRIRFSDTIGVLHPFKAYDLFKRVSEAAGIPVQAHMHNDYGLATANTLAAVIGGAKHVHMTINGLGERAGLAPLEEVVMVLKHQLGIDSGIKTEGLRELCEYVARASNRPISANKAIVGRGMFEHESGIHVDGVLKVPDAFEPFPPETVGLTRQIVIGKHTGSGAVQHVLKTQDIGTDRDQLNDVVIAIRREAINVKRALTVDEVVRVYKQVKAL